MSDFNSTITHVVAERAADGKKFRSEHGEAHNGKACKKVCALTKDHPTLGKHWNVEIGQTVVELEDGTLIAVLNDEVR